MFHWYEGGGGGNGATTLHTLTYQAIYHGKLGKSILIPIFSMHFFFLHAIFSFPHTNRAVLQFAILSSQNCGKN